ncbi:MAG TPA: TadA family conjugal transfer-associated ATPase [Micromonosporaceae bacterium]|jgi:pilus assembly protein CpaF
MSAPRPAFAPIVPSTVAQFRPPRRTPGAALVPALIRAAPAAADAMPSVGALTLLLADPTVTDVLVNGAEVWVDRGDGLIRSEATLGSPTDVRRMAQRLAAACGRRLDEASPYVDARLPDGTRLHAVLAPIATGGPYLSLRTFRHRAFTLDELVGCGTVGESGAELLAAIVSARLSYLVTGGTGSGKTTILNSLLGLVPHHERIVIVEDAPELRPDHPHVVGLSARTPNVEGAGLITVRDLARQALRMRPDRLVIGECRGAEVVDLLGALNTGHEGGTGTLHANAAGDVPARLEALALVALPRVALHAQIASALQVVVHMRRLPNGRVLDEIAVLRPAGAEQLVSAVPAWHRLGGLRPGATVLADLLSQRGVRPPTALLSGGSAISR